MTGAARYIKRMDNPDTITGKVAAIIDDTTLVLSVGSENGVREGQLFAIVTSHDEVQDPDTGASLGRWESVKGRVVVTHVQEAMATARSPLREDSTHSSGTLSAMMVRHSFGLFGEREQDRERLDVRASTVSGRPRSQPIVVGDRVRSIRLDGRAAGTDLDNEASIRAEPPSQMYVAKPPSPEVVAEPEGDGSADEC